MPLWLRCCLSFFRFRSRSSEVDPLVDESDEPAEPVVISELLEPEEPVLPVAPEPLPAPDEPLVEPDPVED
jgi:hypothetical protein